MGGTADDVGRPSFEPGPRVAQEAVSVLLEGLDHSGQQDIGLLPQHLPQALQGGKVDREVGPGRFGHGPGSGVLRLRRWLGPADWELTTCEFDARVGGKWRFVSRGPDGFEMGSGGTISEFIRPEWIKTTELYDMDWTGGETINTNRFTAIEGGTLSTLTVLYASKEARDGARATPMAEGMEMGFQRLDDLLADPPTY